MMAFGALVTLGVIVMLAIVGVVIVLILLGGNDDEENGGQGSASEAQADLTITTIAPTVEAKIDDGDWQAVSTQLVAAEGDSVRTDATGRALLTFFTGDETELTPNTELTIEVLQGTAGGSNQIRINVLVGQVTNRVNRVLDANSRHEVRTPAADATVRGTVYRVRVETNGASTFSVEDGVVEVTAQGQTQTAQAGFEIVVQPGQPPSPPQPLPTPTPTVTPTPTITQTPPVAAATLTVTPSTTPPVAVQPLLTIITPNTNQAFRTGDTMTVSGNVRGVAGPVTVQLLDPAGSELASGTASVQSTDLTALVSWQTSFRVSYNGPSISGRVVATLGSLSAGVQVRLVGSGIPTPTPAPTFTSVPTPTPPPVAFIRITSPQSGATVSPNGIAVTGEAGGIFENSFTIELIDAQGQVVGQQTVTYTSAEVGGSGRFSVTLRPNVTPAGNQASIHAFAISPRDGAILVEVFIPIVFSAR
jgi:hypothetical protein